MFRPLNGRVLIKPDEDMTEATYGIVLPDSAKEKPATGVVVVGGEQVSEGDRVVFSKFGYDEVEVDKVTYYAVSETLVLGIF